MMESWIFATYLYFLPSNMARSSLIIEKFVCRFVGQKSLTNSLLIYRNAMVATVVIPFAI